MCASVLDLTGQIIFQTKLWLQIIKIQRHGCFEDICWTNWWGIIGQRCPKYTKYIWKTSKTLPVIFQTFWEETITDLAWQQVTSIIGTIHIDLGKVKGQNITLIALQLLYRTQMGIFHVVGIGQSETRGTKQWTVLRVLSLCFPLSLISSAFSNSWIPPLQIAFTLLDYSLCRGCAAVIY